MGMTQVCERYNLKLLTYGSLVRSSAPSKSNKATSLTRRPSLVRNNGQLTSSLPLKKVRRPPDGEVAEPTTARHILALEPSQPVAAQVPRHDQPLGHVAGVPVPPGHAVSPRDKVQCEHCRRREPVGVAAAVRGCRPRRDEIRRVGSLRRCAPRVWMELEQCRHHGHRCVCAWQQRREAACRLSEDWRLRTGI